MEYRLADSPYTSGWYIIECKRWWFPLWSMYGHYDYNYQAAMMELRRLRAIKTY